ncbi:MAG: hydroxymethylbilane synthase [candidate division Zixibacteria bacterium]|nr:hydroxymethylbilane synthase [candidate division Zixibacteria bacterium]
MQKLIIGTRGSQLALWQANFIQRKISAITNIPVELKIIKTQGDKITNLSFEKMEGKGFFTKEIEDALLDKSIDLAVHSLKDLQTTMPPGLALTAVGFREDSREAIVIRKDSFDDSQILGVKPNGIIGSSSVRRQCQIAQLRPDLVLKDLRGNVPTRINKLRDRQYDGIVLAYAGIKRLELDLSDLELNVIEKDLFLPAPGQGILGLQTRDGDSSVNDVISKIDDKNIRIQVKLERGLLARFDGGCQLPLGAYSEIDGSNFHLKAVFCIRDKGIWQGLVEAEINGNNTEQIVEQVYKKLTAPR